MGLNPLETSRVIFDRYKNYITTSLRFNDDSLNLQLRMILEEPGKFAKGPIIEATPPYKKGRTLRDLVNDGVLDQSFSLFNSSSLPLDRPLYLHQEQAINKICGEKRNAVVATGTGSGKTESFMIPILNELLAEKRKGILTPGVRALLLYPMNALANDQMKRLRKLLENEERITFGIYTGETEETYSSAEQKFRNMHGLLPQKNELISREQMKKEPPHILLTNYAMLEYLMLRPADSVFFDGEHSNNWKYIVIDEAHTYTGAKGIEMSMLLARLKSSIGIKKGEIRCILTSASLGNGSEDFPKVAEFGSKLFQEEFLPTDVIEASKEELVSGDVWGEPHPGIYEKLVYILDKEPSRDISDILIKYGVPEKLVENLSKDFRYYSKRFGYEALLGDSRVNKAINLLSEGPIEFDRLSKEIFGDHPSSAANTSNLIDLCNILRKDENDNPLIPARYHFFVKALEGAYVTFSDDPTIYLNRMNTVSEKGTDLKAFEVGTCHKCNSIYLIGEVQELDGTGKKYIVESQSKYTEEDHKLEYFAVIGKDFEYIENEDEIQNDDDDGPKGTTYMVCTNCGRIIEEGRKSNCDCENPRYLRVIKANSDESGVHKCKICGAASTTGSVIRRFFLAEDAVSSVLVTALYNQMPNKVGTDLGTKDFFAAAAEAKRRRAKITKQLLVFSDNRQNAAYFATYLNRSYNDILVRNILVKVIEDNYEECLRNEWTLEDYHRRVANFVVRNNILRESPETLELIVWKWIMREFFDRGSNSLESMGYLKFLPNYNTLIDPEILFSFEPIIELGLDEEESKRFVTYLIDQFRLYKAIEFPEAVDPLDDFFAPNNRLGGFCRISPGTGARTQRGHTILAWKPSEHFINSRYDFIKKISDRKGLSYGREKILEVLDILYEIFANQDSPLTHKVKHSMTPNHGLVQRLDYKLFKVVPGIGNKEIKHYKCNRCHNTTTINVSGVCPTYNCAGTLGEIDLEEKLRDNHYRDIYSNLKLEKMDVSEHTAQLTSEYAAEVQGKFVKGDINVLSCSTTFELGVDVGELETVFMKNTPPTPANYAQRAGRAGRRTDSTAYAMTFARLSSHDFSSFSNPYKMISGVVKPPYFETGNAKIAKRHIYACAFSKFWKQHSDYFATVESFFRDDDVNGPDLIKSYLDSHPADLEKMLKEVVPTELHTEIGIEEWRWVDELFSDSGVMTKVGLELRSDLTALTEAKNDAASREDYRKADELKRVITNILSKNLIGFLSQKNALPKYGFPVDVVNMEIRASTQEANNIDLSRDLQIAISEYAPESQVVANGKLWTGRYVKRVRNRELLKYNYYSCKCGYFSKSLHIENAPYVRGCPVCGGTIKSGVYVMPDFGFVAEPKPDEPGPTRPKKTYSSRKHFSGVGAITEEKNFTIGKGVVKLTAKNHGQLTVLNNGKGRGFLLCSYCGYGAIDKAPSTHKSPDGRSCTGRFERLSLGYDFETDIIEIDLTDYFRGMDYGEGFWESLMYAIIEGVSAGLEIDRNDIDGTLYIRGAGEKSLILFDTVPGGAGHVKRLLDETQFKLALQKAYYIVTGCDCGGENKDTSCYSCLRNYYNQYCHEKMKRGYAIKGLERILGR